MELCHLVNELLIQVMVLEGHQGSPIEISDSLAPILIPSPGGNLLVEIQDRTDNKQNQVNVEDLTEGQGQLEGEEAEELELVGEIFEDGETIMDVLRRRNQREDEVPKYLDPPDYFDLGYISNH